MIPFTSISKNIEKRCHFFHGNGYPPDAYSSLLNNISNSYNVQSMLLRQFWESSPDPRKVINWDIFLDDLLQYAMENNITSDYAIGHSIGGNILLRASIEKPNLYRKIVLLDPTIFSPLVIYIWRFLCYFKAHPLIRNAKNRRKEFESFQEVFNSYRSKEVFSRIPDNQLDQYINSIFKKDGDKLLLYKNCHPSWEETMYLTAGIKDFDIWGNLHRLETPTLIIIPEINPVLRYYASKKISRNNFIKIKILKNSTHLFPLEKPVDTSEMILNFLSQ